MSAKDNIWVCWQEPTVDCGKVSQIPHSWISEVLIGDGRAPGSVLKCRWPKTKRQYTAKVIAPPTGPQDRLKMQILKIPDTPDDEAPQHSKLDANYAKATGLTCADVTRNANGDTEQATVQNSETTEGDDVKFEQCPPILTPEARPMNRRSVSLADPSASPSLQRWFILQLNQLKADLLNNFDQVNHKMTAMDLSIRSLRDRVNRMDEKLDLALVHLPQAAGIERDASGQQWNSQHNVDTTPANRDDSDDIPPSLKRQRKGDLKNSSFVPGGIEVMDTQEANDDPRDVSDACVSNLTSAAAAISVTPRRNAKKSIIHRAAPISPPPSLDKEITPTGTNSSSSHQMTLPSITATVYTNVQRPPVVSNKAADRKRNAIVNKMVVHYKPGSNDQVILLGGDPNYEINKDLYAETLDNVYEESPVYLILSLLRRLVCDRDLSRLWFKNDPPITPDTYVLLPAFKEALKKQASMQYPMKTLTERDYMLKLNQATYDAKHRIRRGKGSAGRPESYFPLEMMATLVSAHNSDSPANSVSSSCENGDSGSITDTNNRNRENKEGAVSKRESQDTFDEEQTATTPKSTNDESTNGMAKIKIENEQEGDEMVTNNAMDMLAELSENRE